MSLSFIFYLTAPALSICGGLAVANLADKTNHSKVPLNLL
jgi:hypothetical protein